MIAGLHLRDGAAEKKLVIFGINPFERRIATDATLTFTWLEPSTEPCHRQATISASLLGDATGSPSPRSSLRRHVLLPG